MQFRNAVLTIVTDKRLSIPSIQLGLRLPVCYWRCVVHAVHPLLRQWLNWTFQGKTFQNCCHGAPLLYTFLGIGFWTFQVSFPQIVHVWVHTPTQAKIRAARPSSRHKLGLARVAQPRKVHFFPLFEDLSGFWRISDLFDHFVWLCCAKACEQITRVLLIFVGNWISFFAFLFLDCFWIAFLYFGVKIHSKSAWLSFKNWVRKSRASPKFEAKNPVGGPWGLHTSQSNSFQLSGGCIFSLLFVAMSAGALTGQLVHFFGPKWFTILTNTLSCIGFGIWSGVGKRIRHGVWIGLLFNTFGNIRRASITARMSTVGREMDLGMYAYNDPPRGSHCYQ